MTRACRGERLEYTECVMLAIRPDLEWSWASEVSTEFPMMPSRSSTVPGASYSFPLAEAAVERDPETSTVRVFSAEGGEIETVTEPPWVSFAGISRYGLAERVAEEYYLDTDRELCQVSIGDQRHPQTGTVRHACDVIRSGFPVGEYVQFGHWEMDWIQDHGLDPRDEFGMLHAPSARWVESAFPERVPDEAVPSAAGLTERFGESWYHSGTDETGVTMSFALPAGYEPVAFSAETLVVAAEAQSWNPLVSDALEEYILINTATGEPCAVTRATGISTPAALTGCQALVRDSDGTAYLVGRD